MAGQNMDETEETIGSSRVDEVHGLMTHPMVFAGSAFALGLATGLFLKGTLRRTHERARLSQSHREYARTGTYQENLPDPLERREPLPHPDQPRYGGTGALGVHPTSAEGAHSREK